MLHFSLSQCAAVRRERKADLLDDGTKLIVRGIRLDVKGMICVWISKKDTLRDEHFDLSKGFRLCLGLDPSVV